MDARLSNYYQAMARLAAIEDPVQRQRSKAEIERWAALAGLVLPSNLMPGVVPSAPAAPRQPAVPVPPPRREAVPAPAPQPAAAARAAMAAAAAAGVAAAAPGGEEMIELEEEDPAGTDATEDGHTYAEYKALAIRQLHPEVMGHPDPLVETASLASVSLPPPDYEHSLHDLIVAKALSDAQLETVIYANMKFSGPRLTDGKRAGFFLGDGAGVGKGRQIAALIRQHFQEGGRRALWVSVSTDLGIDARRDLDDVRAQDIEVHPKGTDSLPTGRLRLSDGVLFITYSLLVSGLTTRKPKRAAAGEDDVEQDAVAAATARLVEERLPVPPNSRLAQIIAWLGATDEPPLIVFDECHKAKNLLPSAGSQPTATARAVVELQEQLPEAKVLYSSATGASSPAHMAYMTRLGLWGFKDTKEMVDMLSKAKLGALELAAMSLKSTGTYLARTLSYDGAEFALAHIEVDPVFKIMYDRATLFWSLMWRIVELHPALKKLQGLFWSGHQRFFKMMLMASKVPACAKLAQDAISNGMCAVIGLQSTGEANTNLLKELSQDAFDDLVSAPRMVLEQYIRTQFPISSGGCDKTTLDSIEHQVFQAIEAWRGMLPASEVVQQSAEEEETRQAAQLMALKLSKHQRFAEDDLARMRYQMRQAEEQDKERLADQERQSRVDKWQRGRRGREARLVEAVKEAEEAVADAEAEVARIEHKSAQPTPKQEPLQKAGSGSARAAGRQTQTIADSSDEEEDEPLASRQQRQLPTSGKRKAAVLEDSSDEEDAPGSGGRENAPPTAPRTVVLDLESDEEEDVVLATRRPLSAGGNRPSSGSPAKKASLQFKRLSEPMVVDLTLEDDLECMVCGRLDGEDTMMLCDGCDRGCHTACCNLAALPASAWFCGGCADKAPPAAAVATGQRGRLQKCSRVEELSEEEDEDFQHQAPTQQLTGSLKLQLLAADRRLREAQRQLRDAGLELEAFHEEAQQGPPPTPVARRRQQAQRMGGKNYDPSVRNLQLKEKDTKVAGYKHAVKAKGLEDLPDELLDDDDDEEEDDFMVPDAEMNNDISPQLLRIRGWLLRIVQAMELPPNPLDHLVELLGGEDNVAELTGRKGYVCMEEDRAVYKQRGGEGPKKEMNLREKQAFMDGRKLVAIISDAASTGISLQADRRVGNQRRRCHITLELPWSADKAIQQFGRSHRANQASAPQYRILVTPCGGEYRFASAAAKRLASLGALLRGDRNAIGAGSELKGFDIDNVHGEKALERTLHDICATGGSKAMPGVKVPELPAGCALPELMHTSGVEYLRGREEETPPFYRYMKTKLASIGVLEVKDHVGYESIAVPSARAKLKVPRFLNRLLGLPMGDQELLFQYYTDTLDATVAQLKSEGKHEQGIVSIKGQSCQIVSKKPMHQDANTGGEVFHVELDMDRGISWEAATKFRDEVVDTLEAQEPGRRHLSGFYIYRGRQVKAEGKLRPYIILATEIVKAASNIRNTRFHVQRPNVGSVDSMTLQEIDHKGYKRLSDKEAEVLWSFWYRFCEAHCYHGDNCNTRRVHGSCSIGCRKADVHLVCGAVLPIWKRLNELHSKSGYGKTNKEGHKWPLRVVKAVTSDGIPVVGVEAKCKQEMQYFIKNLKQQSEEQAAGALAAHGGTGPSAAARTKAHGGGRGGGRGRGKHGRGGGRFPF